jgi:hypothetical protein
MYSSTLQFHSESDKFFLAPHVLLETLNLGKNVVRKDSVESVLIKRRSH